MKKILLANIGNRNITLDGKTFHGLFKNDKSISFRDWSKNLLENYEKQKDKLDINIINPLVSNNERPDKIILFYSDQEEFDTRINQDTIYEAKIIKKLLIDKYGYKQEQILLEWVNSKVTDNGNLLKYYRRFIKNLMTKYSDAYFTICDAGGTAQQKMALKLIAEFLLQKEKYEVKYTEDNKLITDVNVDEYRKIISQEQAIKLIHTGEYIAAAQLLDFKEPERINKSVGKVILLFYYIYHRFNQNYNQVNRITGLLSKENKIIVYDKKSIPLTDNKEFSAFFKGQYQALRKILDYFYKAKYYLNNKNYSNSILNFSRFYEALFSYYIHHIFDENLYGKPGKQNKQQKKNFENIINDKFKEAFKNTKSGFIIDFNNLATQCIILKHSKNKSMAEIGKIISPYLQYTDDEKEKLHNEFFINNIRNKIAHEGKLITQSMIDNQLNYYPALIKKIDEILQLKFENIFENLNRYLESKIRQYL